MSSNSKDNNENEKNNDTLPVVKTIPTMTTAMTAMSEEDRIGGGGETKEVGEGDGENDVTKNE